MRPSPAPALHGLAAALVALLQGCAHIAPPAAAPVPDAPLFFDDFSEPDVDALRPHGWIVRTRAGHPGVVGAGWSPDALALLDDAAQPGNRLLRLTARTDGTAEGTRQAQLCQARKFLEGTYAARVRFSDAPEQGPDGDVVVQTFYAVAPLRFDFDPDYSELDWEYLPNGGWGDARTRLYAVSWQTVRLQPWAAYNQPYQAFRPMAGWHTLVMQAIGGRTRWFIDGEAVAEHGGRNFPVVPMAISFSAWFAPGALLPDEHRLRVYTEDVDWVLQAPGRALAPGEVLAQVQALREAGRSSIDTVPPARPPLASPCDF